MGKNLGSKTGVDKYQLNLIFTFEVRFKVTANPFHSSSVYVKYALEKKIYTIWKSFKVVLMTLTLNLQTCSRSLHTFKGLTKGTLYSYSMNQLGTRGENV